MPANSVSNPSNIDDEQLLTRKQSKIGIALLFDYIDFHQKLKVFNRLSRGLASIQSIHYCNTNWQLKKYSREYRIFYRHSRTVLKNLSS